MQTTPVITTVQKTQQQEHSTSLTNLKSSWGFGVIASPPPEAPLELENKTTLYHSASPQTAITRSLLETGLNCSGTQNIKNNHRLGSICVMVDIRGISQKLIREIMQEYSEMKWLGYERYNLINGLTKRYGLMAITLSRQGVTGRGGSLGCTFEFVDSGLLSAP